MEKSYFFDSDNGDRKYSSTYWAEYFSSFIENGIFLKTGSELSMSLSPYGDRAFILRPGKAFINGYGYSNERDKSIEIPASHATLNRIDSIVIQWNLSERQIRAKLRSSTPAENPTPVTPVRNAEIWELVIAEIYVGKGNSQLNITSYKDKRYDTNVCGIVTSVGQPIDTTKLNELIDKLFTRYDELEGRIEGATLIRTFSAIDYSNKIEITAEGETVNTGDIIAVKLTNPGNDSGVQPGATLKFNSGQAQKISVLNGAWKTNPIAQYATVLVEKTSTGWNLLTFDGGSSGNIPDFSPSLNRVGHTLYKAGTDSNQWGMGATYFCNVNSAGKDNTTDIGAVILSMAKISPVIKLNISGDINVNYGPIIVPDLSSSPFNNLTLILDFSGCNIKCPNNMNSNTEFVKISDKTNITSIHIRGLKIDHAVAPLSVISVIPQYTQQLVVYIEDCLFMMGRQATQKINPTLITEASNGVYPTYHFIGCVFKSNYLEDYDDSFDMAKIMMVYPSSSYKSFVFFTECQFLFMDGEVGAMASAYGAYGLTNTWLDNHYFRFSGCVMANDILTAQSSFSSVNTTTRLQQIFNNSNTTGTNILY